MFSTQIERIKRDINSIQFKIIRCQKQGKTQKAHDLQEIQAYMLDQLGELREACLK